MYQASRQPDLQGQQNQPQKAEEDPQQIVHHEWRTAENSAAYLLPKLRSMSRINPQLSLLDVGGGSGTISVTLAKNIPDGKVTAVDINPDILARARTIAKVEETQNIEFLEADVYKLPFADATFDVTHCHQVLTHLQSPSSALREMVRVTKPGGVVAAREGDLETECVWPDLEGLTKFHTLAAKMIEAGGGTAKGGRQLLSWALSAGVKRDCIANTYSTWSYTTTDEKQTWAQGMVDALSKGRLRQAGLAMSLTTEDDLEKMIHAWQEWMKGSDSSLAMMSGEIIIQR